MRADASLSLSRRQFLGRCGVLGAALAVGPWPATRAARAQAGADALQLLAVTTISGLVAFVVPGPDRYSEVQGLTDPRPGGIDARAPEAIVDFFDRFLPMPDSIAHAMAAAFATGVSESPLAALDPLLRATEQTAAEVDRALQALLANDEAIPLSLAIALMLNYVATSVNPAALTGPFPGAPFANLAYAEKAEVLRRVQEDNAELAGMLDRQVAEPMRGSLSGQIEFVGGALPAAAALYSYSEWGVLDPKSGVATARPVGWDLSGYELGRTVPADGWKELKGYYRGRRRARRRRRRNA